MGCRRLALQSIDGFTLGARGRAAKCLGVTSGYRGCIRGWVSGADFGKHLRGFERISVDGLTVGDSMEPSSSITS